MTSGDGYAEIADSLPAADEPYPPSEGFVSTCPDCGRPEAVRRDLAAGSVYECQTCWATWSCDGRLGYKQVDRADITPVTPAEFLGSMPTSRKGHDAQCESDFIEYPVAWTPCQCEDRGYG